MAQTQRVEPTPPLRERARLMARREILDAALRLFIEQGYDATTTEQIAREAGVSQRTLFRYFGTKQDLIGIAEGQFVGLMKDAVLAQPVGTDPWTELRAAFGAGLAVHADPTAARDRFRLLHGTDSLRSAYLRKQARCQDELLPVLQSRHGAGPADRMSLRALLAAAFGCFDAAVATWLEDGDESDVLELYDRGVAAIRG